MSVAVARTEAEEQLARQFAMAVPGLPGGDWVPAARSAAIELFDRAGLPHRRIEEWKYTDLRTALRSAFPRAGSSDRVIDDAFLRQALGPELGDLSCIRFVLVNGRLAETLMPPGHEAGSVYVWSQLARVLGEPGHEWLKSAFEVASDDTAAVRALNTAFVTDGLALRVSEGRTVDLPIHIVSIVDADEPVAVATRNLVCIEAGARASIIESHVGVSQGAATRQVTAVTQISVGEGAEAHHVLHVAGGADAVHLGQWDVELAKDAVYRGFQLTAGAGLARNETHVRYSGPDAKLDLSGLMLGRKSDHIDTTLVVDHTTTGCEGRELFKAVLDDRARAVFQGKVIVEPQAQKTDGKQMAQALMLSPDAEFDSKPELEIYADDVACGHGSTAAELDADKIFYLRARGIPLEQARELLIQSFAAEALDKIDNPAVRDAMEAVTLAWLGALRPHD
ncbi:MAG: Fe-S cluster assembly protein SufD [Hyphomicrobiaceae bacterium]